MRAMEKSHEIASIVSQIWVGNVQQRVSEERSTLLM